MTIPRVARRDAAVRSRTSTPPIRTAPASTSYRRGEELGDGRLAGAGGADEGDGPAGFGAEGDAVQHLGAAAGVEGGDLLQGGQGDLVGGRVGEVDGVELDGHRALGHLPGRRASPR